MNNQDLRAILIKIQDHLSDDDRKRLYFFLGDAVPRRIRNDPSLESAHHFIESLIDQDKIREHDTTYLMKIFEEIRCDEAVKLLKEYINKTHPSAPPAPVHDDEKSAKNYCDSNNMLINSNNTNINPVTVVLGSQSKRKHLLNKLSMTRICLLLLILLSIILTGLVIINYRRINGLIINHHYIINEQKQNNIIIQHLKNIIELNINQTIQQLSNRIDFVNKEKEFTEGNTCGCTKWCNQRGTNYGVCGDGHTCICRMEPIMKDSIGHECTCDVWCRKHGHKNGGICGDGYTCICSK